MDWNTDILMAPSDVWLLVATPIDENDEDSGLIQEVAIYDSGTWTNASGVVVYPRGWCTMPSVEGLERESLKLSAFDGHQIDEVFSVVSVGENWWCAYHYRRGDENALVRMCGSLGEAMGDIARMAEDYRVTVQP